MKKEEIARLLPEIYRRTREEGGVLDALLAVMESFHDPVEQELEGLAETLDPHRTSDEFVPFLAGWVDLDRLFREPADRRRTVREQSPLLTTDLGRLRVLVSAASELSRWRGTKRGLVRFMELATGLEGFRVEEHGGPDEPEGRPYHITVRAPAEAERWRRVLERIVRMEKPAHVTHELVVDQPEEEE